MAGLDDEQPVPCKVGRRLRENRPDDRKPVIAAGERKRGFLLVLVGQAAHGCRRDVRRVREDEIIAGVRERIEQVRLYEADPRAKTIGCHVAFGYLQRCC